MVRARSSPSRLCVTIVGGCFKTTLNLKLLQIKFLMAFWNFRPRFWRHSCPKTQKFARDRDEKKDLQQSVGLPQHDRTISYQIFPGDVLISPAVYIYFLGTLIGQMSVGRWMDPFPKSLTSHLWNLMNRHGKSDRAWSLIGHTL